MALSINNNIAAVNSYRNLSITQNDLSKSLEKLSSGFRINRAADDAAGLAISEGLRSQVGGLKVAVRNAQDGISVVQTAEGALTETHAILQRMRDLSVQASNTGGLSDNAKSNIQKEISELKTELNRIADTTKFNGKKLLDGNYDGVFQIGANANPNETINVKVGTAMSAAGLGVADVNVEGGFVATAGPGSIDFAGSEPTIAFQVDGVNSITLTLTGWDTAGDAAAATKNQARVQNALSNKLEGTGFAANVNEFGGVTFATSDSTAKVTFTVGGTDILADAAVAADANVGGTAAITAINDAIGTVSTVRAELGAKQNRLDHTINSLNVAVENLSASESRIRDTDMASEMVNFTRSQILSQAGTAMLAQANQIPQGILQLLR